MFHSQLVPVSALVSDRAAGPVRRVLLAEVDVQLRAGLAAALRSARLEVIEVHSPLPWTMVLCRT
mgnify:CR=1 FL=1